jgi:peroxiredoxin
MSERDPFVALLKDIERPVSPRPEFANALRARLLTELAPDGTPAGLRIQRPHLGGLGRLRRPVLAGAVALAVAAAGISAYVLSRPSPASALDVIREARNAFASAPPFEETLRVDLNADGSSADAPKGASATVVIHYGGPGRFRTQLVSVEPSFPNAAGAGSYQVYNGRTIASYDSKTNRFSSVQAAVGFRPLDYLSWHGSYPDWERICRAPGSKVLPNARIAGRDTHHIRCSDYRGDSWELWIDTEAGLLLKIVGQFAGDDLFLDLGSGVTSKGGFEVQRLRLHPSFPARTFSVAAPEGAFDYTGRLHAAAAKVPPFRAVIGVRRQGKTLIDEVWWRNRHAWRHKVLAGHDPAWPGGPGSFVVAAPGGSPQSYNASDNTYSAFAFSPSASPITELLPVGAVYGYSAAGCPVVGRARIAGQDTVHRHCASSDVWIDTSAGLILRQRSSGYERRVRTIQYRPTFPPGTFRFTAPPGSHSARQRENDPYYKTALAPGQRAPNWSAPTLDGRTFTVTGLRGKPALLLLFSDTCPPGDPTCDVFGPLKRVYKDVRNRVAVVWVDLQGTVEQARKIARHNHVPFPVVVDYWKRDVVSKAWKIQNYPYWLLLDSHGRVMEARLKPQTTAQLRRLLAGVTG